MYPSCMSNWESLAEYWDCFEGKGLNPDLLARHVALLEKPLGVIGCGRGLVLKHLEETLGSDQVWGFDASGMMVAKAKERGCRQVFCVPPANPVPEHLRFKTLLAATGVLDPLEPHEIVDLLLYLKRRLLPKGRVWLYAFSADAAAVHAARQWGCISALGFLNSRFLELVRDVKSRGSFESVILPNLKDPQAIDWARSALAEFDEFVLSFSKKIHRNYDDTLAWLQSAFPEEERLFHLEDLLRCLRESSLTVVKQETLFDQEGGRGVHVLIAEA